MSELTLAMLFSTEEIDSIDEYCVEKNVSIHDLVRTSVLEMLYR